MTQREKDELLKKLYESNMKPEDLLRAVEAINKEKVITEYENLGKAMVETMVSGEVTAYDKCLSDCLMEAILGVNPFSPIKGELKTYALTKAGQMALDKAKKKGFKTVVVKIGSKAVPGLGAVSTLISVGQFVSCASKCEKCE